jgi:hypothetical protein
MFGTPQTESLLIQLLAITHELGIRRTVDFKNQPMTTSGHSLYQLMLDRQGVRPLKDQKPKLKTT